MAMIRNARQYRAGRTHLIVDTCWPMGQGTVLCAMQTPSPARLSSSDRANGPIRGDLAQIVRRPCSVRTGNAVGNAVESPLACQADSAVWRRCRQMGRN